MLTVNLNISGLQCAATSANEYLKFPLAFLAEDLTKNFEKSKCELLAYYRLA